MHIIFAANNIHQIPSLLQYANTDRGNLFYSHIQEFNSIYVLRIIAHLGDLKQYDKVCCSRSYRMNTYTNLVNHMVALYICSAFPFRIFDNFIEKYGMKSIFSFVQRSFLFVCHHKSSDLFLNNLAWLWPNQTFKIKDVQLRLKGE